MRLWLIIALATVFGGTAGVAMTWLEFGRVVESFQSVATSKGTSAASALPIRDRKSARAVVEGGNKYNFGTMAYGSSSERTFVIRNEGEDDLTVEFTSPSCGKCIETTFTKTTVPPGKKCEILVTYHARKEGPSFEESANLHTNDPLNPELSLTLTGIITKPIRLIPENLTLGSIPASDPMTTTVTVLSYHFGEISLKGHKFNNTSLAESFEVTSKLLSNELVKQKDEHATCGLEVTIASKPGLPLGPINENMTLTIQAEAEHNIDLPVVGEVVGDITVAGKNYAADRGILPLGLLKQGEGKTAALYLLIKGPHRNDVKITVGEVNPADSLKVTVGEGSPLGRAVRVPVTIEVLKSAPAQTHMGDARGPMGKIVLETTHPTVKQIPIQLRYVIE